LDEIAPAGGRRERDRVVVVDEQRVGRAVPGRATTRSVAAARADALAVGEPTSARTSSSGAQVLPERLVSAITLRARRGGASARARTRRSSSTSAE
jgi:hypothetical protein